MKKQGLTAQIAAFAADRASHAIPPEAIAAARRAFIDTIGVALAGRGEAFVGIVAGVAPDGNDASALPGERQLSARDAALVGGMAGHALDYDDVARGGHPSVVLVPAILAEAQRIGASGSAALEAYVIGFEVWGELARREPDAFHLGSWHPTPVLGILAATAALCALDGLSAERSAHALAIAASLASGVIANFGTPVKPYQAGRAASGAVEAVALASAGLAGAADAIEGAHGLLRGISPQGRVDTEDDARLADQGWRLVSEGLSVKRYPVCYASHRAIDAAIALTHEHDLSPGDVASVTVRLGKAPAETLRYAAPKNGSQARFSLQHNVAAALVDRAVGFAQLDDGFVTRSDVAALYPLTRMDVDESDPCPDQPGMAKHDQVTIALADGRTLDSGPIRRASGHAKQPLSNDALAAKFRDCARHSGYAEPETLLEQLQGLEALGNIRALFAANAFDDLENCFGDSEG